MYDEVKCGSEVKLFDLLIVVGRQYLVWNNWLVDEVEWTKTRFGHQN